MESREGREFAPIEKRLSGAEASVAGTARSRTGLIVLAVALAGATTLIALGSGSGCRRSDPHSGSTISFSANAGQPLVSSASPTDTADAPGPIVVYVTGAVKHPGIYTLKKGDRLNDAVLAAGGFKSNAALEALNMADRARDGDHLNIPTEAEYHPPVAAATMASAAHPAPFLTHAETMPILRKPAGPVRLQTLPPLPDERSEAPEVTVVAPARPAESDAPKPGRVLGMPASPSAPLVAAPAPDTSDGAAASTPDSAEAEAPADTSGASSRKRGSASGMASAKLKNPGDGVVNLNTATEADLEKLPRCGPAMAARILAYRATIGHFDDVHQLQDLKCVEK